MPEDAPQDNLCPQCSRPLPSSRPRGLCPACLLKRGLETNTVGFTDDAQAEAARRWTPPTVEQLAPLFPELDIIELIGRGGMGAVYKAREKQLDRLVALKVLPPEIGRDDSLAKGFAQRFAREAQAMAKLSHPNIVTIHSFGQREMGTGTGETAPPEPVPVSLYFFIMEYVDGLSLRQLLDAGTVNPKEALAIVPQICDALQYAHDRGIVHRDIKPENILLSRAGQVKIADFGLAKLVGLTAGGATGEATTGAEAGSPMAPGVTQAGEKVMGTPQYMAPEQIDRPGEVDHRADIYSLGVVFYQMLTGELPVGRFEPPSRKVLIDVRLDEVVLRALQREPSRRYQQVSEVKTRVETIATSLQPTEPAEIGRKDGPTAPPAEQRRAGSSFRFGTAVRWTARILGTLWIGLLLLFVVGEGVPAIGGQPWAVQAGFIAMGLWMLGFILGWWRDGIASVVIVLGSILFHAVEGRPWLGGALELPGAIALLYALSWWLHGSARQPAADEPASTKHPFPLTPEQIQAINHARRAVKTPAIGMFVTGAIYLGLLIVAIIGAMTSRLPISTDNPAFPFVIVLGLAFLAANVFVLVAASNMRRLRNHRSAVAASILILFPLGSPLGLIFGIWALVVLTRREVVEAFKTSERDRTRGKSRTLLWLVLAVVAVLTPVALWAASKAGQAFSKPESQPGGQIPSAAHFGSDKGSVYVVHAGDEVHYVFFHKGDFSSSTGSSQNAHSFTWIDKGSVKLANGQTFGFLRESADPVHLSVNGKEFDLRQGRVLILHEDGSMEQIKLFPTMAVARSVDALAKAVDSATFTAQPAFGPVVERTINDLDDGKGDEGLVLATGQVVSLPPEFGRMSDQQRSKWIEDRGIDLFVEYVSNRWGFMSCGPQLNILNAGFEDVSPASIGEALVANSQLEVLERGDWTFYLLPKESKAPLTLALRTPAGGVGVLQIVGFTDNPKGARIRYKLLQAAPSVPHVLKTTPVNFANDVDPSLDRITVTFDRPMMDKNWSFTAGDKAFREKTGSIFPQRPGEISYDAARTTCTMSVKLQPGKVYWVGVNDPQHRNFKSADGTPARPYQILFATPSADGKPTPLPEELVKQATQINAAAQPATQPATATAKGKDPEAVRELALSVLRAIKEDDFATLKSLSAGSRQGWLDVDWRTPMSQGKLNLVGQPPAGWSENDLKNVTAEIRRDVLSRNPDAATKVLDTLVRDDWAATLSPVTSSQYLVMVFVKTDGGWRFATLDQSKGNLADDLAKHMANIPANLKVLRQLDHSSASQPATQPALYDWQRTDKYVAPDFDAYFPDDAEGGRKLDVVFDTLMTDPRPAGELLAIVRKGLRRTTKHRTLVQAAVGSRYIWGKSPQNPQAVEIMYHAAQPSDRYGTLHYAVYYGLSVLDRKPPNVLRTLADIMMQARDNNVGRISWGCRGQTEELRTYLRAYLQSTDPRVRDLALAVDRHLSGEADYGQWRRSQDEAQARVLYGSQFPAFKKTLSKGGSEERLELLRKALSEPGLLWALDDSFVDAFTACAADRDARVRNELAVVVGSRWIWKPGDADPNAVELMLKLSHDEDQSVRYNSVYYGLSVVRPRDERVIARLREMLTSGRDRNSSGRIEWGLKMAGATTSHPATPR